jgi:4,5-dihydroxyphthalate decarboxylase
MSETLRAVFADYGPAALLRDGTIAPEGCAFEFVEVGAAVQGMTRMVRELAFDVVDMSPTTFLAARSMGVPLVALPIAVYASYPHAKFWTHRASNITTPSDLRGKNIGIRTWLNPANIWLRGMLSDEFGVDLDDARWTVTVDDPIGAVPIPAGARRTTTDPKAYALIELLSTGEVDAAIDALIVQWRHAVERGLVDTAKVAPLFADGPELKEHLFRRFGYLSIGHIVVMKRELLERAPGAAAAVYDAFLRAKERYLGDLAAERDGRSTAREAWAQVRDLDNAELWKLGIDPLPTGETVVRTIEALARFMTSFGYLAASPDVRAEFAAV